MQPTRSTQKKGIKFLDTKVFIASLSIAVTVGMWNIFSHSALAESQEKLDPKTAPPPATAEDASQGLLPLPTLIPLISVTIPAADSAQAVQQVQPAGQSTSLRSVAAPTQVIVQKVKPVFNQPASVSSGGGGGGGRSGGKSVTTTKSSR